MEKLMSSKIVYECPIFKIEEALVELPDKSEAKRWYILMHDGAVVVCLKGNSIIMLKEYRSASGQLEWRIPAGALKDGEDPKEGAIRETREEIGLEPLDIRLVKSLIKPSGSIKQVTHIFVATKFRENPLPSEDKEELFIKTEELPIEKVKEMISTFEIPPNIGQFIYEALRFLK
ncbi:hypothetical protein COX25_02430 [bacterium (Candidatus Howlettbacteria) CG23_combo_of_CG06-09_8_20_14_all_37_9]|nr:MAG: hypothetical protein COX25_02430 [bacterium (Candidatus Howlettbacteria) CG23_combo_of_CG06-09_8_20_14_all_37_9]